MPETHRAAPLRTADDLAAVAADFDRDAIALALITQQKQSEFGMPYRTLREILTGSAAASSAAAAVRPRTRLAPAPTAEERAPLTTGPARRRHWWAGRPRAPRRKSQLGAVTFRRLDRERRTRLWFHAQALERRTKLPRKHGGMLGDTGMKVLRALLFDFLNMRSGRCDPGHEAIAEAAGVAISTVAPALDRLETSGLVQRIRRAYWGRNALGRKILLQNTNAYLFTAPADPQFVPRDTERRGETQSFFHIGGSAAPIPDDFRVPQVLEEAASD